MNRIPEAPESWRGEKKYRGLLTQVWLVPQSRAGETLVRVANFSDKVVTLTSHLPFAEYHTVSDVSGSAAPTEIGGSP